VSREDSARQAVRRTAASFLNLFGHNDGRRWDRSYSEGHWTFLDSLQQRPRHYVIAGMLRARGGHAASVLDVGCGTGALVPHLPRNVSRYVGIDISSEAIRICREHYAPSAGLTFEASGFDDYKCRDGFEAIVFNEMLYYYPTRRIPGVISRACNLLKDGAGAIIVSVHDRSLKRRPVWRKLRTCMSPAESMGALDPETGNSWRVELYDVHDVAYGG
jgi:2-polyprenyl-3-methyl-5-hydroxy-6-metoxy-1,4-benzoquinol methylase